MISSITRSWRILLQTVLGASRSFFIFIFIFLTLSAQAIIDSNSNGVSDLWEKTYNSGTLFTTFDPLADPDGDGWNNGAEAISGTDPGAANTPTGILRPQIIQSPAVYINGPNGDPEIFTPAAVSITWPALAGKQYTLFASVDLTAGSWLAVDNDTPRIGTTDPMGNAFPIAQPDGSSPPTMFYRVAINDADSDGDTLTNHEESQLQTDPFSIDTDLDGLPDNTDPAPLSSATLANPDGTNPPLGSTTNLLGFWDFESQNAPAFPVVFPDKSGNGRHANGSTGPQALGLPSLAGRVGPGTITVPSRTINGSPTYTVTGWFKLGQDTIKNASSTIFKSIYAIYDRNGVHPTTQAPLGQGTGLFIRKNPSGGEEWFVGGYRQITFPNGNALTEFNGHYFQRPAGTSDDAKWHHFAVTRSATSLGQKVYFDGVLVIQQPLLEYTIAHDSGTPPANQATTFTFGSLYPGHGPSTFVEAFIDRVRVQSRLLTATEIQGYYRQDIDQDGLWDTTETSTALWRDTDSNGQASATEYSYSSSPFNWQPTNTDTDTDGLTDTTEQDLGTKISNPDSDGDLLPDGWEVDYQLDPHIANSPTADTDLDGLGLLDEYRYNTNPTLANTDGDPQNDGNEVAHNSNPNDASDGGNPTPLDQQLSILLGIGDKSDSHSEDYVLNCYRLDPQTGQETRIYTLRSGGYGQYNEETQSIYKKGQTYTFQIDWQSSKLTSKPATPGSPAEGPDYDYTFKVQPQGSNPGILIDAYDPKTKTVGSPLLAEGASDVATTEAEFKQNFEDKRVYLLNMEIVEVISDQIAGVEINKLPSPYFGGDIKPPYDPENPCAGGKGFANNPMQMGTRDDGKAYVKMRVKIHAFGNSQIPHRILVGMRVVVDRNTLSEPETRGATTPVQLPALTYLSFDPLAEVALILPKYEAVYGWDGNEDGKLQNAEVCGTFQKTPLVDSSGAPSVNDMEFADLIRIATPLHRDTCTAFLYAATVGSLGFSYTEDLLASFITGDKTHVTSNPHATEAVTTIAASELSHPVGIAFTTAGIGISHEFVFDESSEMSEDSYDSMAFRDLVTELATQQVQQIIQAAPANPGEHSYYPLDIPTGSSLCFSGVYENYFLQPPTAASRLFFSLKKANIAGGAFLKISRFYTDGSQTTQKLEVYCEQYDAELTDVYDFVNVNEVLPRSAAIIQARSIGNSALGRPSRTKAVLSSILSPSRILIINL